MYETLKTDVFKNENKTNKNTKIEFKNNNLN